MKLPLALLFFLLPFAAPGSALSGTGPQTQLRMQSQACFAYANAGHELDALYSTLLSSHKGEVAFVRRLRSTQEAWKGYREKELDFLFPLGDPTAGSSTGMCRCIMAEKITRQRIEILKKWLEPDEGDVCGTSY
jgi:uncharacterized protein YecT (DUF1311 family)